MSGCAVPHQLDPSAQNADLSGSTIIVMGVSAPRQLQVSGGTVEPTGEWNSGDSTFAAANAKSVAGYIVVKLAATSANQSYALTGILDTFVFGNQFHACNGGQTMTFDAPAGKVIFVGDLVLDESSLGRGKFRITTDSERARAYLRERYPALADRMIAKPGVMRVSLSGPCNG